MIRPVPDDPAWVAAAAQLACLLEASAPKPGNVSPGRHFGDTRYEDFLASAAAIGSSLKSAPAQPLGRTIRQAIEATAAWTTSNTNLGIVLLLSPLAAAAPRSAGDLQQLRAAATQVIEGTTIDDARDVYAAIRMAQPGGLGRTEAQDVASEPSVTLRAAMALAADRDGIAREYASGFAATFDVGVPALRRGRADELSWDDAIVETFLTLLASAPDTHIARRGGPSLAAEVSGRASAVLAAGGVRSQQGRRAMDEMDAALRDPRNTANPGTTADLTAASIFAFVLTGGWPGSATRRQPMRR